MQHLSSDWPLGWKQVPCCGQFQGNFHQKSHSRDFGSGLGNVAINLVEEPDAATKVILKEWLTEDRKIPSAARHMLVTRIFPAKGQHLLATFENNPVEVTLLEHGGGVLENHDICYYPAHKVSAWIHKHCTNRQRKRHLLSVLCKPMPNLSQDLYNYSD
jgi:hypothetical protein